MKKIILCATASVLSVNSFAGTPVFSVTPIFVPPSASLVSGETATGVFQVANNTARSLSNIGLAQMPSSVSASTNSVSDNPHYCTNPFTLAAGASCLLKVNVNTGQYSGTNFSGGPIVCYSQSNPVLCSQPFTTDQLNFGVTQSSIPQDCASNVSNFSYELSQNFDDAATGTADWGPGRRPLPLSPSNPNLTNCPVSAGVAWQRQRIVAAAQYWISQKLNYCHHHVPDFQTTAAYRNATLGGYCNPAGVEPSAAQDPYYDSSQYPYASTTTQVRWNYSGKGSQTPSGWVGNNQMWYGMDCSNYTAFLYNFALNVQFDSQTGYQAGQAIGGAQDSLLPSQQTHHNVLKGAGAAGELVCADGTTDPGTAAGTSTPANLCAGHGGYLTSFNSSRARITPPSISTLASVLKPGDILFIAGGGANPDGSNSIVTHAIMWLGKQVGYGPNDINPSLVAPNDSPCESYSIWQPTIGSWLITDSHYQGPDYRVLTDCFYLNNLYGVRRVIL
jgi:hypothetical protein